MAGAHIRNESGGPNERERVYVPVGVAYGVDIAAVKAMLLEEVAATDVFVNDDEEFPPVVHLMGFGASSVDLVVKAWVHRPELRSTGIDCLNVAIYKRLHAEGVEIPFPKQDVYLHRVEPAVDSSGVSPGPAAR